MPKHYVQLRPLRFSGFQKTLNSVCTCDDYVPCAVWSRVLSSAAQVVVVRACGFSHGCSIMTCLENMECIV